MQASVLWQKGVFKESVQWASAENPGVWGSSPSQCCSNSSLATISPKGGEGRENPAAVHKNGKRGLVVWGLG